MSPSKTPQTQCPRAIRECSKSVQSKSGLAALPASVLPEKTEVCRLYFYLTLPNRWCAQMRRTERRGYRTAKAVELLVEVRRRTENRIPSAYAKRSLPNGKQMRRSWLQLGQGSRKPGQGGRWQIHVVGMPGRRFLLRISHGRAIAAWRGLCVGFAFAVPISRLRCFFKRRF